MAANPYPPEVIDLLDSSSEDEDDDIGLPLQYPDVGPVRTDSDAEGDDGETMPPFAGAFPADDAVQAALAARPARQRHADGGMVVLVDGEEVFIPDEDPHNAPPPAPNTAIEGQAAAYDDSALGPPENCELTVDDCLQHVLEIFPDISREHVRNLYTSFDHAGDYQILSGRTRLNNIVEQLVSSTTYPKEDKGKLKRKRESSIDSARDVKKWERTDRVATPGWAKGAIAAICKADFPTIPRTHINHRLVANLHLFQTYVALSKDMDDSDGGNRLFGKGRASKAARADADTIAMNAGHDTLVEELAASREHVGRIRSEREAAKAKKLAEEENLRKAVAAGETAECSVCYDDLPMNRQIHCSGKTAHFLCFGCAEMYIKTEVGDARCRVLCTAGCGAGFAPGQLNFLENKQLLEKLAQIQQEQDIREAGLDDLEECPFCDFKAIMPSIEEDFEFRCANPACERVSCRRCKAVSHVPISCEQHADDSKLSSRHQIEEAMTAALVRSCNKCKKQFIKESGCNKMHCTSCHTLQCYVCSATVTNYDHFDQGAPRSRTVNGGQSKKCPLYDNVEERHEREVKEAEAKARAEVVERNPDVTAEDLEIKVSDAVRKAEDDRLKRAAPGYRGPVDEAMEDFLGARGGGLPRFHDIDLGNFGEWLGLDAARGAFRGPRRPLARAHDPGRRQRELQVEIEQLRAQGRNIREAQDRLNGAAPRADHAAELFQNREGVQQRPGVAQHLANAVGAAAPLQRGFIPVYFRQDQQAAPPQQAFPPPPPAAPPARYGQQAGFPGMFDDILAGDFWDNGGVQVHQQQQARQPASGNDGLFYNPFDPLPLHNAHDAYGFGGNNNLPGVRRQTIDVAHRAPQIPSRNAYVPGGIPNAPQPRQANVFGQAQPAAQQPMPPLNPNLQQELDVLRLQHEHIQRLRQQAYEQRQRQQQQQQQQQQRVEQARENIFQDLFGERHRR